MKVIGVGLIFLGAVQSVLSGGVRVKASLGGNATIRCLYERGTESYPKYLIKGKVKTQNFLVKLNGGKTWATDVRSSLRDDRELREFTVSISNLSMEDAGQYWCGVKTWWKDTLTEVNLDIVQEMPMYTEPSNFRNEVVTIQSPVLINKHVIVGLSLTVVAVLVSMILGAMFIITKKNNTKRTTACTDPKVVSNSARESYIYDEVQNIKMTTSNTPQNALESVYSFCQSQTHPESPPSVSVHYCTVGFCHGTRGSGP